MEFKIQAEKNLLALKANPYPGRGIIVGLDETGEYLVQVYWIMGRSENSRNRVFVISVGGELKTAAADLKKVKDPSLIIYKAMAEVPYKFAVSNGHQTRDALFERDLGRSLKNWEYEPDKPNYTPRITAICSLDCENPHTTEISILKKSPFNGICDRYLYNLEISERGVGYCVTTYSGDGDPLPSFSGDPYLLPLVGDIKIISQTIWNVLNEGNRVSLAVKFINIKTKETSIEVINKYNVVR